VYLEHFGLTELPFGITPDTSFVFSAAAHQEALNTLLVAMQGGEGFIKVTAEVGTGKTLLCRRFLSCLGDNHAVAYIPNPALPPDILLQAVAEEIGLDTDASATEEERFKLVKFINARLLQLAQEGKTLVLCIDEAQTIPLDSLEMLRLLSNLETEKRKLIHIVLFGQPELDEKLSDPSVRQLRQRIAFHYRMPGLRRDEVEHYLAHRLRVAGYRGNPVFSAGVAKKIHAAARGTPRLINILAHKSMLSAFGEGKALVGGAHVNAAARDTEGARRPFWPF
jgi:MSHA biogenesis protein MshM